MISIKILNDDKLYPCFINFSGNKKQFFTYMYIISFFTDKKYDFNKRGWKFKEIDCNAIKSQYDEKYPQLNKKNIIMNISNKDITDYDDIGNTMKLKPYSYQKETIKFALDNLTTLLVLPCGSGKTPIGIGLYLESIKRKIITGVGIIVVKASLKTQWLKEIEKFSNLKPTIIQTSKEITSSIRTKITKIEAKINKLSNNDFNIITLKKEIDALNKQAKNKFKEQFVGADLLIMNYETLNDSTVRSELHRIKPQFFFVDEIHYVKSADTTRSKSLCEFSNTKIKAGATATPVQRDPRDIYGIFKFVNPLVFPKKSDFDRIFLKWAGRGRVVGGKNEELLSKKISPYMIVKTKEEISTQLPVLFINQRYCDLEPAQIEMTKTIKQEIENLKKQEEAIILNLKNPSDADKHPEILKIHANILARQTFAQEIANSEQLLILSDSKMAKQYITGSNDNKIDLAIEIIEEILNSGEKVCIFSKFAKMQIVMTDRIQKESKHTGSIFKNIKIAYINGKLDNKQRYEEAYDKFRDNDDYKILMASDAGAEGLNLSNCKYIIELELADSYAIQTQRHGRLERADSVHNTVFVYQLIANNSWDEVAIKIVSKKEKYDSNIIKNL